MTGGSWQAAEQYVVSDHGHAAGADLVAEAARTTDSRAGEGAATAAVLAAADRCCALGASASQVAREAVTATARFRSGLLRRAEPRTVRGASCSVNPATPGEWRPPCGRWSSGGLPGTGGRGRFRRVPPSLCHRGSESRSPFIGAAGVARAPDRLRRAVSRLRAPTRYLATTRQTTARSRPAPITRRLPAARGGLLSVGPHSCLSPRKDFLSMAAGPCSRRVGSDIRSVRSRGPTVGAGRSPDRFEDIAVLLHPSLENRKAAGAHAVGIVVVVGDP